MPKRKENQEFACAGEKDCWHSYGLQMLNATKFTNVVGKILRGRYVLISSKLDRRQKHLNPN